MRHTKLERKDYAVEVDDIAEQRVFGKEKYRYNEVEKETQYRVPLLLGCVRTIGGSKLCLHLQIFTYTFLNIKKVKYKYFLEIRLKKTAKRNILADESDLFRLAVFFTSLFFAVKVYVEKLLELKPGELG
jgi:hypothetical protein